MRSRVLSPKVDASAGEGDPAPDPATLRKALNDAIRQQLITSNPAVHVELPSGKRPKPVLWTAEHVTRWQQTGHRHYNGQRPHRSLQLRPPLPDHPIPRQPATQIRRRTVLVGLL